MIAHCPASFFNQHKKEWAMTTQENRITDEDRIKADNLARSGWEAASGKGAEWQQAVLKEDLSMEDAITLAIGQLQAACYVLKMFLVHAQPKELVLQIAKE